jgi:MFS family permease
MVAAPFAGGVAIYAFYAMQPYLLDLYGRPDSYGIAGLAAAVVASTQIAGGYAVPFLGRVFRRRTSFLLCGTVLSGAALAAIGLVSSFGAALALLGVWAMVFAATTPMRQAYINGLIPSEERATVLSTDNLLASAGGVVVQPVLGRIADGWSYATSYVVAGGIELLALPFLWLARRERAPSDPIEVTAAPATR